MGKQEAQQTKKSNLLGKTTDTELIPAFEATKVTDVLDELSSDKLLSLHRLLGGDGSARVILFFIPEDKPIVSNISFRHADEIKYLLGYNLRESKFKPGIKIEIKGSKRI